MAEHRSGDPLAPFCAADFEHRGAARPPSRFIGQEAIHAERLARPGSWTACRLQRRHDAKPDPPDRLRPPTEAFDRAEFMQQRRQMVVARADYLDKLRDGAQVLELKGKVA